MRGPEQMRQRSMAEVVRFGQKWVDAGSATAQHWSSWEQQAADFFGLSPDAAPPTGDVLHGVMTVVVAVCFGDGSEVKRVVRSSTPKVLGFCVPVLGHLPAFHAPVEAEHKFRGGELSGDWTLSLEAGRAVIRTVYRQKETHH